MTVGQVFIFPKKEEWLCDLVDVLCVIHKRHKLEKNDPIIGKGQKRFLLQRDVLNPPLICIFTKFGNGVTFCLCMWRKERGQAEFSCFCFFSSALETGRVTVYWCLYDRRLLLWPTVYLPAQQVHNSFVVWFMQFCNSLQVFSINEERACSCLTKVKCCETPRNDMVTY